MNDKGSRTGKFARVKAMLRSDAAKDLTSTQNHILRILWMDYARLPSGADEATCYPSIKTIADDANCSTKTVERALRALELAGLISAPSMHGNRPVRTLYLNRGSDTVSQTLRHCVHKGPTLCPQGSDSVSKPSDIVSAPIRKNRIEPDIEPDIEPACARSWQGILLPDGVVLTDADNPPVNDLARHIREHYPDTRKIQHRMPLTEIVRRAAPHIVSLVETHGTIADACEAGKRAVDAVAAIKRADPDAKPLGLKRWLDEGGLEYANPIDFMPYLRSQSSLNRPYGASQAPDESRVAEILERIRANRSGLTGQSRRIAQ